jgi:hypothetical protein
VCSLPGNPPVRHNAHPTIPITPRRRPSRATSLPRKVRCDKGMSNGQTHKDNTSHLQLNLETCTLCGMPLTAPFCGAVLPGNPPVRHNAQSTTKALSPGRTPTCTLCGMPLTAPFCGAVLPGNPPVRHDAQSTNTHRERTSRATALPRKIRCDIGVPKAPRRVRSDKGVKKGRLTRS